MTADNIFYRSFYAMGTRFEMIIPEGATSPLEALAGRVEQAVQWWEERLSRFREESDIARINREGADHPVVVDEKVFTVLEECDHYHRITEGLFDPAILSLQAFWQERDDPALPPPEDLPRGRWKEVVLDPAERTVALRSPEAVLDPGAFGKGVALRAVRQILEEEGIQDALLSFGGSSILALGHHPHGPHWPVSIPDIFNPAVNVYLFEMRDQALSTSGVSAQRLPRGEKERLHVLNPLTGEPVRGWKSVSVQHTDPFTAEVLSTAFLAAEEGQYSRLLGNFPDTKIILVEYLNRKPNIFTFEAPKT